MPILTPAGAEGLVNTTTAGDQFFPQVVRLTGGGYVVSWVDGAFPNSDIRAQLFSPAGVKVGGEILVNTATAGQQSNQKIVALSDGRFVVTWQDDSRGVGGATGDASFTAIKAQIFDAAGAPVGSEILVNTATAGGQTVPDLVPLAGGNFAIAWTDRSGGLGGASGDSSSPAVKAQVFTSAGVRVGSEILVNTAVLNGQDGQEIAALSNGGFVITWHDASLGVGGATGDTSGSAVKAQVFAAGGSPVGTEILVNLTIADDQVFPSVVGLAGGGFAIAYGSRNSGGFDVHLRVFDNAGVAVGGETLVNTATDGNQISPWISALTGGGFVVAWTDGSLGVGGAGGDTSGLAVKMQVFGPSGAPIGSEIRVNTATVGNQTGQSGRGVVTPTPDGGFVVMFEDASQGVGGAGGDTSGNAIKGQAYAADGTPVGGEFLVNASTVGFQGFASGVATPGSGMVAVYDDRGGSGLTGDTSGWAVNMRIFGPLTASSLSYSFATITAAQASGLAANDTVLFSGGPASGASVAFLSATATSPDRIAISHGDRTVSFGTNVAGASQAGNLVFADSSVLYVGDSNNNGATGGNATGDAFFGGAGNDTLQGGPGGAAATAADVFQGNAGDDSIVAGSGNDTLYGGQGGDTLATGAGANFAQGNLGNDSIAGGSGTDTLLGGRDNDTVSGGGGADFLNGNLGNDSILGAAGADTIFGEDGADTLAGANGTNTLNAGNGDDSITSGSQSSTAFGGDGADSISVGVGGDGNNLVEGAAGDDTITTASSAADTLSGGQGNDTITSTGAVSGGDTILGDIGDDSVSAQGGAGSADSLQGEAGNDTLVTVGAVSGADTIDGGTGDDLVNSAGTGADSLLGGDGADTITDTGGGSNAINGQAGNDQLNGGPGNDSIFGAAGNDTITDAGGSNLLDAGDGNDQVTGGGGTDSIVAGAGVDTVNGGAGKDFISAGAGADRIVIGAGQSSTTAGFGDQIADWSGAEDTVSFASGAATAGDYIELTANNYNEALTLANNQITAGVYNYVAIQIGSDVVVFADSDGLNGTADDAIVLVGRTLADISSANITA